MAAKIATVTLLEVATESGSTATGTATKVAGGGDFHLSVRGTDYGGGTVHLSVAPGDLAFRVDSDADAASDADFIVTLGRGVSVKATMDGITGTASAVSVILNPVD